MGSRQANTNPKRLGFVAFLNFPGTVWTEHLMHFLSEISILKFLWHSMDRKHLMHFLSELTILKFLGRSIDGKHLMRFQSETFVFKFLRRSVDGKYLMRFHSDAFVFKFLWFCSDRTFVYKRPDLGFDTGESTSLCL